METTKHFVARSLHLSKTLDDDIKSAAKRERRSVNSWISLQLEKALHPTVTKDNSERKSA
jgi:predicted HicB family RNase H-like nuclease